MQPRRRLILAALGVVALGSPVRANDPPARPAPISVVPVPATAPLPPTLPPAPVAAPPAPVVTGAPVVREPCPPDCPPPAGRCQPACGPRVRLAVPPPQIIFRTTRERRVVEAAPCPTE